MPCSVELGDRNVFSYWVVDARVVLVDLKIVEDDPGLEKLVRVGVRVVRADSCAE